MEKNDKIAAFFASQKNDQPQDQVRVTDLVSSVFPRVSDSEKTDFIQNTNALAGNKIEKSEIADYFLKPKRDNPAITGQVSAINLALHFAEKRDLIPRKIATRSNFDRLYPWFRKINLNILGDYVEHGTLYRYNRAEQTIDDIQTYRNIDLAHSYGASPYPSRIRELLADAFNVYSQTYRKLAPHLDNPRMIDRELREEANDAARAVNLKISAIKPFVDGSNRVGRITENILRLNIGSTFNTFEGCDLARDIQDVYKKYYRAYSPRII